MSLLTLTETKSHEDPFCVFLKQTQEAVEFAHMSLFLFSPTLHTDFTNVKCAVSQLLICYKCFTNMHFKFLL